MIPTVGVFRWSFRWLPLFHLVLALCAAEALALFSAKQRRFAAVLTLMLLLVFIIASFLLRTAGDQLFPLAWFYVGLAFAWTLVEPLPSNFLHEWTLAAVAFAALLATYLCLPTNCGVPKYNLAQSLLKPQPLDAQRLYFSVYPPPENFYRVEKKPQPVGQIVRPGSTSMWAGLRFINGYSPIRPAGIAREFYATIHGEIDPGTGDYLLNYQAGEGGELARLGVDGIVVARELDIAPQPPSEWQLVVSTDEGRVFH